MRRPARRTTSPQDTVPTIEPVPLEEPELSQPFEAPVAADIVAPTATAALAATQPGDEPLTAGERTALRRQVLTLSWPVIVENLLQSLIGFVDTALVGHLGTDALAGVGGAQQIVFLTNTLLSAVMMGATVLVAHAIGARNPADARSAFKQSLILAAALAVLLSGVIYVLAAPALQLLGLDSQAAADGVVYLQISGLVTPVMVGMYSGAAVLRGAGNTRTPMYITGFINVINAAAAWMLIYGFGPIPALGVAGSAWAAGVARLVGCALLVWVFLRPGQTLTLRSRKGWRPNLQLIRRMLNIGIPTAGEQFMLSLGMTLYGVLVISLGTSVYAAQRSSMMIVMMAFLPGLGFAMAATTLVGQSLGAGRIKQAEEGTGIAARWCMILMGAIGVVFGLFGEPLMHIFSDDPTVTRLGGEVLAGGLRGAGDTRYPMLVTMIGVWCVRLPIGWVLGVGLGLGLQGIYYVYVADCIVRAVLFYRRWRQARWKTLRV
jgi:putative MATE family efflux protein